MKCSSVDPCRVPTFRDQQLGKTWRSPFLFIGCTWSNLSFYGRLIAMTTAYLSTLSCVKRPLSKRPKIGFQDQLSLNAGQKYCRMLREHSAILSTFLSYHLSLRSLFCLFLNGHFTQALLYMGKHIQFWVLKLRILA